MVARYINISPSEQRLRHFKGDVSTILLVASEVMMWIAVSLDQYFDLPSTPVNPVIRNIHTKCSKLFETLSLVVSPLHILYKVATDFQRHGVSSKTESEKRIGWLQMIRPGLMGLQHPDKMTPDAHLTLQAKLVAHQSEPMWPAIVMLLLSHKMKLSKLVLLNFGAFVPGENPTGSRQVKPMTQGCEGFQCQKKCIGPADEHWAQAVGSAIVRLVVQSINSRDCLIDLFQDFFEKLSTNSWECIDANQTWNMKRPIWLQAVIHLIEPHLIPALDAVLEKIESNKTIDKKDVRQDQRRIFENVLDVMELIPVPVLKLCAAIESKLPSYVQPTSGSVMVQMIICGIYNIVMKLQLPLTKIRAPRDKTDYLLAFGEALLNIEMEELLEIKSIAAEIIKLDDSIHGSVKTKERDLDTVTSEASQIMAELIANDMLSDESGQFALKVLHRFINYNTDWLQSCLGITDGGVQFASPDTAVSPMIKPWGSDLYPPPNPISMMNQIGGSLCFNVAEDNQNQNVNSLSLIPMEPVNVLGDGGEGAHLVVVYTRSMSS